MKKTREKTRFRTLIYVKKEINLKVIDVNLKHEFISNESSFKNQIEIVFSKREKLQSLDRSNFFMFEYWKAT